MFGHPLVVKAPHECGALSRRAAIILIVAAGSAALLPGP